MILFRRDSPYKPSITNTVVKAIGLILVNKRERSDLDPPHLRV